MNEEKNGRLEHENDPVDPLDLRSYRKSTAGDLSDTADNGDVTNAAEVPQTTGDEECADVVSPDDAVTKLTDLPEHDKTQCENETAATDKDKKAVVAKKSEQVLEKSAKVVGGTLSVFWYVFRKCIRVILGTLLTLLLVGIISGVVVGSVFFIYVKNNFDPEFNIDNLQFDLSQTTTMWYLDENGVPVELEDEKLLASENRTWASYSQMPQNLVNAFIAVEDKRFREHNGVDLIRTTAAFVNFFIPMKSSYGGGSTITQQLIKNFTEDDDVKIQRKIQEILRAWNLETKKTKDEILEMYLNIVDLSQNACGVQAAAQTYFGKDVSELTLVECAALAALPKSPTKYDPIRNPENNLERRRTVLSLMYEQEMISWEEYTEAYAVEELTFAQSEDDDVENIHSYYIDAVINDVIEDLMEQYGYSEAIASAYLYSGGLKIITCMNPFVQDTMEDVYETFSFEGEEDTIIPQSAMVVMDPDTGDVLGIVGGRGEKQDARGLNRATQSRRQCGSAIKPLSVYSVALDNGFITYGTVMDDVPLETSKADPNVAGSVNRVWPTNSPEGYQGLATVNYAVLRSLNTISARIVTEMGPKTSFDFLTQKLHFSTLVESYTSQSGIHYTDIALSPMAHGAMTFGVTVMDMCAGYTALANEGTYSAPRLYSSVTDSQGTIILEKNEYHENVMKISTAFIMTKMLEQATTNRYGTAYRLTINKGDNFPTLEVAGKTGTTNDDRDRYFCGYTPYYVGATWFGYDNNKILSKYSSNPAMQLWDEVMKRLHQRVYEEENGYFENFVQPGDVIQATYCKDSGMLVGANCGLDLRGDRSETGWFLAGTEPVEVCDKHILVDWDTVTQAVASHCCPSENVTQVALVKNDTRDFALQVYVTDAEYIYRDPGESPQYPTSFTVSGYRYSAPFFYYSLVTDRYCGTTYFGSSGSDHAANCFCWEHYDPTMLPDVSMPETSIPEMSGTGVDESDTSEESTGIIWPPVVSNPWG